MARAARLQKEVQRLTTDPPEGVVAWPRGDNCDVIDSSIRGPAGTPYEGGEFRLELVITDRYPFEPPRARFLTPVYHPNIDSEGRICLDTLKMPPKGAWLPSVSLSALLTTIRLLLSTPNPDDGLMPDISRQYQMNPTEFDRQARKWTEEHARGGGATIASSADAAEPKPQLVSAAPPSTASAPVAAAAAADSESVKLQAEATAAGKLTPTDDATTSKTAVPQPDPATVVSTEPAAEVASPPTETPMLGPPSRKSLLLKRRRAEDVQ